MKILVTGSSGLIGSALVPELARAGHRPLRAARGGEPGPDAVRWDPATGALESAPLAGIDAVVHLAGLSLAGRWSERLKQEARISRVEGTMALCRTLARLGPRPRVLLAASAVGYYGDRGEELLEESSARGRGFLAELAEAWERACQPAIEAGIRVVHLRFGVVLARAGGALPRMLLPFRLGLGGPLGSGRQHWSWIALEDLLSAIRFALERESLHGPVNVVAPEAVRQRAFAQALGRALHRPAWMPAPAFALRLALGEMADEMLLASTRVRPARLLAEGFAWRYADPEVALREVLAGAVDAHRAPS